MVKAREEARTIHLKGCDDFHSCKARRPRITRKNNRCTNVAAKAKTVPRNMLGKKKHLEVKTIRHMICIAVLISLKVIFYLYIIFQVNLQSKSTYFFIN